MFRYYLMYKPYMVLSQFSREGSEKKVLGDVYAFPSDVYPFGRLDEDSEGALLLSNERSLTARYANGRTEKEYWVQVEGRANKTLCTQLQAGVNVRIKGKDQLLRARKAEILEMPVVAERTPPIRYRKEIPDTWIRMVLTEGKNRQVRKMTAAAGFPTLRLIRFRIGLLHIAEMQPGAVKEITRDTFLQALKAVQTF